MSATSRTVGIKAEVKKAGKKAEFSPLMEALMRLGYGVRGGTDLHHHGSVGSPGCAGKRRRGRQASPLGAIAAIGKQRAGMVLSWLVLIGLISYALWGVVRSVLDPLHKGRDLKGLVAARRVPG